MERRVINFVDKIKKISLIFAVLSCGLTSAYSQNEYHEIYLKPKKSLDGLSFSFSRIIDAREDKSNIGIVQRGIGNKKVKAKLGNGFTNHLTSSLKVMLPKSEEELALIIRKLEVSEKTFERAEFGFCTVSIEFAWEEGNQLYTLGVITISTSNMKGVDVTTSHDRRILKGLQLCFELFNQTNWVSMKGKEIITDINYKPIYDYKSMPPPGIYFGFPDLVRKKPIRDNANFSIKQISESNKFKTYHIKFLDFPESDHINFVVHENEIYMRVNKYAHFVKMTIYGKYIYFRDRFSGPFSLNSSAHQTANGLSRILTILNLGSGKGIYIDTEKEEIHVLSNFTISKLTKDFPEIRKEYRESKRKLADKELVILKLNEKFE